MRNLRSESHIDFRAQVFNLFPCVIMTLAGWEAITNDVLNFRKVIVLRYFMNCNLLVFYLSNHRLKKINYQLRKKLQIYKIIQRLKLWAHVSIAVSPCPAVVHVCRWTFWTIHSSPISSSEKNTRLKTKKIRNIQ